MLQHSTDSSITESLITTHDTFVNHVFALALTCRPRENADDYILGLRQA
jgi:hypothetical protein